MKDLLIALIALLIICFVIGKKKVTPVSETKTVVTDTIRDTLRVPEPYPVYSYRTGKVIHDTLPTTADSTPVVVDIPITAHVYKDSNYRAVVSGYRARLDSIEIYKKTIVTTITNPSKPPPRYSIAVQAGYGATKTGISPYVGIGISFNIISF